MKHRATSTHRMDTPDRHNGLTTDKQMDVVLCKLVCLCLRWRFNT